MSESAVQDAAMRLLAAIHDLSGGKLYEPVPVVVPGEADKGAAPKAGIDPGSTEDEVAIRYLVDQGYVRAAGDPSTGGGQDYELTVAGLDRARQYRGLGEPERPERGGMSDGTQKMLVTVLGIVGSQILARPLTKFIGEQIPERRGVKDDVMEAVLKGLARAAALTIASIIVRQLALRRR
ncbi:hypothetical protein GBA63_06995 [Rubrobacter tropicus]|uniref:Uncharacterized protein n=1 Tax=Rubrobacter tropicus TaxID=2653851 RepID=A0A6G8Q7K4_9ACTN|nr:hypothetical protein [Rubrobacter tropicus]QIN82422.1 hypothetical protein GBA63_06995 [Rubrobacter tropicus]